MKSEDLREKIKAHHEEAKPVYAKMTEAGRAMAALSEEYQKAAISERLGVTVESGIIVGTLDIRMSPASVDSLIDQLKKSGVKVTSAIHDRQKGEIHLFFRE